MKGAGGESRYPRRPALGLDGVSPQTVGCNGLTACPLFPARRAEGGRGPALRRACPPGARSLAASLRRTPRPGWVSGHMTGAEALVETLLAEGCRVRLRHPRRPGERTLGRDEDQAACAYLLVTHEFSAAVHGRRLRPQHRQARRALRRARPGRDQLALPASARPCSTACRSSCIVGDVARGDKYRPFQVHELPQVGLLQPVTKGVFEVQHVGRDPRCRPPGVPAGRERRARPGRRRRPVQPAHRDARAINSAPLAPPGAAVRRGRLPARPGPARATASCASASTPASAAWTTRAALVAGRRAAAGAGRHQRLGQGRHPRVPSARGRLGLRPAGHAHGRAGLQARRRASWPSASATARSRPASTRIPQAPPRDPRRRQPDNLGRIVKADVVRPRRRRRVPGAAARTRRLPAPAARSPSCTARIAELQAPRTAPSNAKIYATLRRRSDGLHPGPAPAALRADALVFVDVTVSRALGGRGVHGLPAADLLQPDRQPGDGLVDPRGARRPAASIPAGRW